MTDLKTDVKTKLVPSFVAITLLYSLIYHIMMYRAVLQDDITEDDCAERRRVGGIVPPQCLELEVFRDWHEKDTEELLIEATAPNPPTAHPKPLMSQSKGNTAVAVDHSGETVAISISEDLAGLEKKFSQLVVSSVHLDVKYGEQKKIHGDETASAIPDSSKGNLESEAMASEQHSMEGSDASQPKDFAQLHADMEARHKRRTEQRAILVQEIHDKMENLDVKLSGVVSDRKAWESTLLEKYDAANLTAAKPTEPSPVPNSAFMSKRLQWPVVVPVVHHHKTKSHDFLEPSEQRPIVVSKGDVRHLDWAGKLPKVAAITWIRGDRKTKARMMYFVDNFKLQDYEGPRELLLVYHYQDTHAANIVNKYADGIKVRGVTAHDFSQESFPSDPALRYAAWASDAEVVAQWDFDEWHDPSRLSLQVRAMAYASRHACVLATSSTSHSQEDETKEFHTVSLVGDRAWMKEHWHPFSRSGLKSKIEVTESFLGGEVVELDMQNKALMSNVSRIEHVFVDAAKPAATANQDVKENALSDKSGAKDDHKSAIEGGTEFSRGIAECLSYDTSKANDSEAAAEKAISESVGEDFGKKFHALVKRRIDITMKLQLLCFQTTMEKDSHKRKFMHDHVLEMDHIRVELDKHIESMASLFSVSNQE